MVNKIVDIKNVWSMLLLLVLLPLYEARAQVVHRDSVEIEDVPSYLKVGGGKEKLDSATLASIDNVKKAESAMKYKMWHRYIAGSDTALRWYRNVFLSAGAGIEQMVPPAKDYHFDALTQAQFALGIQVDKYSAIRMLLHASLGYQKEYDRQFGKAGLRLDHLFDWTSYFGGYRAERLMGVSSFLGGGFQVSGLSNTGRRGRSLEGHGGLQLHFYTGPHGMINIEPYIGVATDNMDLSESRNWRRLDIFYGANLNYVYYFSNHLTRAARMRLTGSNDSTLVSWQAPWFFEFSAGPGWVADSDLPTGETLGHNVTGSVGKWFSPVIGLKASAMMRTMTWRKETDVVTPVTYVTDYNTQYYSGRLEALFNPLGFLRSFRWDAPFGAHLVAGGEYGWFVKEQSGRPLRCRSEAYTAGLHLWARLSQGISFFVEPRFSHNVYKIPYTNVNWNRRFSDNSYGINIGLTATAVRLPAKGDETAETVVDNKWQVGAGGGVNIVQQPSEMEGDSDFPLHAHLFAGYRFSRVHGVRLGVDYLVRPISDLSSFVDYNMQLPEQGYAPVRRYGQWNHTYRMGFVALDYDCDLGAALTGARQRQLFTMQAFAGPALMVLFGEGGTLDGKELLQAGHEVRPASKVDGTLRFAINGGAKLCANVTRHIGITLTPQLYYVPNMKMPQFSFTHRSFFETLDLGVQYSF